MIQLLVSICKLKYGTIGIVSWTAIQEHDYSVIGYLLSLLVIYAEAILGCVLILLYYINSQK